MKYGNDLYWVWLSERIGSAYRDLRILLHLYTDPFDIFRLDVSEIEHIRGLSTRTKSALCDKRLERSMRICEYCASKGVSIIGYHDPSYPDRLRVLEDPPTLIYVLGKLPRIDDKACIGIVGTRKMSEYGRENTYKISYELASAGMVVISGMARGIDAIAACAAIEAGSTTVAVLGCGIDTVYPKEHARLMAQIARHGAVITEYAPGEPPYGKNFPKRNRIISALSNSVLVVECTERSGSLITSKYAIAQGKPVYALPGKIGDKNSEGTNNLIKDGARPALSSDDIVEGYSFLYLDTLNIEAYNKAKGIIHSIDGVVSKYGIAPISRRGTAVKNDIFVASNAKDEKEVTVKQPPSVRPSDENRQTKTTDAPKSAVTDTVTESILSTLDGASRRIFENMPCGEPVSIDRLAPSDMGIGDVMTSLTLLELNGLIESVPGGMYLRRK